jgi:hypothetical protein
MKNKLISLLLYIIVLLIYVIIRDYEILFMWLCWGAGMFEGSSVTKECESI